MQTYIVTPKGEDCLYYKDFQANSAEQAAEIYVESMYYDEPFGEETNFEVDVYRKDVNSPKFHKCGGFTCNVSFSPCFNAYDRDS